MQVYNPAFDDNSCPLLAAAFFASSIQKYPTKCPNQFNLAIPSLHYSTSPPPHGHRGVYLGHYAMSPQPAVHFSPSTLHSTFRRPPVQPIPPIYPLTSSQATLLTRA